MRERAVRLGKTASLIGVLAEPRQGKDPSRPGIVFLNSGILHHIGACRLHVRLARRLAEAGFTSLRFDLSGIGDSEARKDSLTFEQSAVLEVQEAMSYLTTTKGVRDFILIGLCSGADMAFNVSQVDARVVGVVQLDAYVYRTFGYYVHHYAPRLLSVRVWKNWVMRLIGRSSGYTKGPEPGTDYVRPEYRRRFPPRHVVESGLRTLNDRGVDLLFLFSGGQPDHYNHRRQHARCFRAIDFQGRFQEEYYRDADHLFSGLHHQEIVDDVITTWVGRFAARPQREPQPESAPEVVPARSETVAVPATAFRIRA